MPLKGSSVLPKTSVHTIPDQKRRESTQHALVSRAGTPSHASDETRSRSGSNASNKSDLNYGSGHQKQHGAASGTRRSALALKLNLPKGPESRLGMTGDGGNIAAHNVYKSQNQSYGPNAARLPRKSQSAFDDTESFDIDSDSLFDEIENTTMVFRGDHKRGIQDGPDQREDVPNNIGDVHDRNKLHTMSIELNTQDMAAIEQEKRLYMQEYGQESNPARDTIPTVDSSQDQRVVEFAALNHGQLGDETPSRNRTAPVKSSTYNAGAYKTVSFDSPGFQSRDLARAESPESENVPSPSNRHSKSIATPFAQNGGKRSAGFAFQPQTKRAKEYAPPSLKVDDRRHELGRTQSGAQPDSIFDPSRESDYPTSDDDLSQDQRQSRADHAPMKEQTHGQKRQYEADLDHNLADLKTMTYKQLDQESFINDPRNGANDSSHSTQGSVTTLPQKLEQLSKMSEEEQKKLFLSQDDEEWTQTGSWFIDRLQDHLKSLTEIRIERRKISMRFEDEIKRRQKDVDWAIGGIEKELQGLKRGGGELIRGRSPHSGQKTIRET